MSDANFDSLGGAIAANLAPPTTATTTAQISPTTPSTTTNTSSNKAANSNSTGEHNVTKPRLSLLSSKQSGIRLKSEDSSDQITILSVGPDEYANIVNANTTQDNEKRLRFQREAAADSTSNKSFKIEPESQQQTQHQLIRKPPQQQTSEDNKMNISNEDLLRLLSMLKSELHSKEIALAAIKCEQLKRLINPVEISRSSLANTYMELQDRFRLHDQQDSNNNATNEAEQKQQQQQPKSASAKQQAEDFMKKYMKGNRETDESDRENLNILNTLLELLDRHPLLALPRDSIYCLDYNCNELSTKNYLNLKIQHLDNLINQHRRFRYYMNERLKRSEQRYLDLTQELELDRNLKATNEKSLYTTSGKTVLLKHIDQLKEDLEKVKKDKQAIVMTLLNDLLDERERIETLEQKLANYETASVKSLESNAGYQQKLSALETQLNTVTMQLKKQSIVSSKEKNDLQSRADLLEAENANLKAKLEQQEIRLAALSRPSTAEKKDSILAARPQIAPKLISQQQEKPTPSNVTEATNLRSGSSAGQITAKSPISRSSTSASIQGSTSNKLPNQGHGSNGSPQANVSQPKPTPNSAGSNKPAVPPVVSSRLTSAENAPIRVQPLFKSASVLSTNQQVRHLKNSVSVGGSATNTSSNRSPSTNNQPVAKPQVPAKPAQLWEQQRNSIN